MATLGWNAKTTSKKQSTNCIWTAGKHLNPPSYKRYGTARTSIKKQLKKANKGFTHNNTRGEANTQHSHTNETTPQFRGCQILLGKLEQKWEASSP